MVELEPHKRMSQLLRPLQTAPMPSSPFKFLDSYGRGYAASFFGRERATDEPFSHCFAAPILVVYGGSGTGKTSLVQCGLDAKFQESDRLPITIRRAGELLTATKEALRESPREGGYGERWHRMGAWTVIRRASVPVMFHT